MRKKNEERPSFQLNHTRRRLLGLIGSTGVLGTGLAGCLGDDDDSADDDGDLDGDEDGDSDAGEDDEDGDSDAGEDDEEDGGVDDDGDDDDEGVATFEVTALSTPEIEIVEGETFDLTANIENVGDAEGTQDIELQIEGETAASISLTLEGGANEDVRFTNVETDHLDPGEYEIGVYSEANNIDITLVIEEAEEVNEGLLHHWPMSEGSGDTVADAVGEGDGTIQGDVEWVSDDWLEGYAVENGSDGIVEFSGLDQFARNRNEDFAIAYTIETSDTDPTVGVLGSQDDGWDSISLYYSSDFFNVEQSVLMTIRTSEVTETAIAAEENGILDGGRHRVVINKITNDAENWEIYVDGEQAATSSPANGGEEIPTMGGTLRLFEDGWDEGRELDGTLDNVQITMGTLTEDDVAADYDEQPWS